MWLKILLNNKILSVWYSWTLSISVRCISIKLHVLDTIESGDYKMTACIDDRDSVGVLCSELISPLLPKIVLQVKFQFDC